MMKEKSNKPHTKKIRTMALSVFLAIIVWFMVMSLTNPNITTTVSNLNVRFVGEMQLRQKQLAITGRSNIPQLSVKVSGNRSDLMNFLDSIYVQVDVSSISETGEYNLTGTITVPTTRITVEKENYGDIPISVEPLVSKEIDVTVKQTGMLRNKIVSSVVNNPKVTITGAESEVEKVHGAVATVDISRIRDEEQTERVSYLLTDASGALINDNETLESARSEVDITSIVYDAKTLPVEPVLTAELDKMYTLNTDKTTVSPAAVTVGVSAENTDEKVVVLIDRPSDGEEREYSLQNSGGMYIPPENRIVRVKAQLEGKPSESPEPGDENAIEE